MACARCTKRVKDWEGDDPVCAFDDGGGFVESNWNCATMNALRELIELQPPGGGQRFYSEDRSLAVLPLEGTFITLGWYKNRGRVDFALLFGCGEYVPLNQPTAEAALDLMEERR